MGPNGSGKSTLAYVLAGHADYEITQGDILWDGQSLLDLEPDARAIRGRFSGLPVSAGDPGRRHDDVPALVAQCGAQGRAARRN